MRVAVIGARMAGLACADALAGRGHRPVLFDKGRAPGGRMSTRRAALAGGEVGYDHGAQYFTVRDPAFAALVARWERDGIAARWPEAGPDAWVGVPGMSAPVRALAAAHDVRWGVRVEAASRGGAGWRLEGAGEAGAFDAVVVAVPAEQAAPLLAPAPDLARAAAASGARPCWTLMAAFAEPLAGVPDVIRDRGPIGWAARDSAKPGRAPGERWVAQAAPDWSVAHLEEDAGAVAAALLAEFARAAGGAVPTPVHLAAHRWRYARSRPADPAPGALWDPSARIGACGDWLLAPRVEAAWLSGRRLGDMMGGG